MKKSFLAALILIAFASCNNDKKATPAVGDTTASSMAADALKNDVKAVAVDSVPMPAISDTLARGGKAKRDR